MSTYAEFLARKTRAVGSVGHEIAPGDVHPSLHDWQREIVRWAVRTGRAAIWADTGLGKQQPVSEPVLTPVGWRPIGGLAIGDQVIGSSGHPTVVTGVFPQGRHPVYRLWLSDGTYARAGAEHLWAVRTKVQRYRGQSHQVLTTEQIASSVHRDWQLPMIDAVQFDAAYLPTDPYQLGVLLGDGCITRRAEACTDNWIGEKLGWRHMSNHESAPHVGYWLADDKAQHGLESLGLLGKRSWEKWVPGQYLHAPECDRRALLAGLMDTDGYAMPDGGAEFCSTSWLLVDAVCELTRSLGGVARGLRLASSKYEYGGEMRQGREAWRVNIKLPAPFNPFRLPRKAAQYVVPTKYQPARIIRSIEDEGISEDQVCISVSAPDKLYVTRDYILTHNTRMQLEWARLSGGTSLIVAPLAVSAQTAREAARIGMDARYVRSSDQVTDKGVWITNYEMVEKFDPSPFDAVVLDESSILKAHDGKTRTKLIRHFASVPRRLACTATPAPNDPEELTNQAEYLGICSRVDMLATYFIHDDNGWRLKKHAVEPMYEWMTGWALALRKPSDLGYSDDGYILPGIEVIPQVVDAQFEVLGQLFATDLGGVGGRATVRRETLDARCDRAAELVTTQPGRPWILWAGLNKEADRLARDIPGAVNVHGSMRPEEKAELLLAFADGEYPVLVSKLKIAGFGLNLEHCSDMIFVGLNDSSEMFYQGVRRCHRFGQKNVVKVHVVVSELERQILDNVNRKLQDSDNRADGMIRAMRRKWRVAT